MDCFTGCCVATNPSGGRSATWRRRIACCCTPSLSSRETGNPISAGQLPSPSERQSTMAANEDFNAASSRPQPLSMELRSRQWGEAQRCASTSPQRHDAAATLLGMAGKMALETPSNHPIVEANGSFIFAFVLLQLQLPHFLFKTQNLRPGMLSRRPASLQVTNESDSPDSLLSRQQHEPSPSVKDAAQGSHNLVSSSFFSPLR